MSGSFYPLQWINAELSSAESAGKVTHLTSSRLGDNKGTSVQRRPDEYFAFSGAPGKGYCLAEKFSADLRKL